MKPLGDNDSINLVLRDRLDGVVSRRDFMKRAIALGLALPTAAALLEACSSAATTLAPSAATSGTAAATGTAAAAAAATGTAAAAAATFAAGERLRFWAAPQTASDGTWWPNELQRFTAKTGLGVDYRQTAWNNWLDIYTAGFSGSQPPDVYYNVTIYMPRFADAGKLLDFSKIPGVDIASYKALYPDYLWNAMERKGGLWGIPNGKVGGNIIWNKAHFTEVGLDPEVGPKTWEELRSFAKKLTKPDGSRWGYGSIDLYSDSLNVIPNSIINYGGDLTNPDDTEWIATGPDYAAGLEAQRVMFVDDKTAAPMSTWVDQEIYKAFFDGKISILQALPVWIAPLARDPKNASFQMGIGAPLSGPKNNQNIGSGGYWSIASAAKDPAACWALVDWLSGPDIIDPWCVLSGLFAARTDLNPFANDPLMQDFNAKQAPYARLPLLTVSYWQTFMDECTAAFIGQKTSTQALADAASKINAAIKAGA